jgi:hypothetical protein
MAEVGLISTYRDSSQTFLIYSEVGVSEVKKIHRINLGEIVEIA